MSEWSVKCAVVLTCARLCGGVPVGGDHVRGVLPAVRLVRGADRVPILRHVPALSRQHRSHELELLVELLAVLRAPSEQCHARYITQRRI